MHNMSLNKSDAITNHINTAPCFSLSPYLYESHVDLIDVRSLFPVHLDADKVLLEDGSNLLTLKRLSLHHVTPVAGRVTNRQEDRLVLGFGLLKCFSAPWVPEQNL